MTVLIRDELNEADLAWAAADPATAAAMGQLRKARAAHNAEPAPTVRRKDKDIRIDPDFLRARGAL